MARHCIREPRYIPPVHVIGEQPDLFGGPTVSHATERKPVGAKALRAITKWANEKYGAGNWELSCAFGDHHSDIPMLSRAADAFAITPDSTLSRTARENDWHALDWNCKAEK